MHEPVEDLFIDTPEEHLGTANQLLAVRKGQMINITNNGTAWVRIEFKVPSHGLIGFRNERLTTANGTGTANAHSARYELWFGEIMARQNGSMVADLAGVATPYAMITLQECGRFFVEPTSEVCAGMVAAENSRAVDLEVNFTKEKQLNNMRAASADTLQGLTSPKKHSPEDCLDFPREDECVQVTPEVIRIRKV